MCFGVWLVGPHRAQLEDKRNGCRKWLRRWLRPVLQGCALAVKLLLSAQMCLFFVYAGSESNFPYPNLLSFAAV